MATYIYDDTFEVDTSKHGTGGSLNMREKPTPGSTLVCRIPQSSPLKCDKEREANNWMPCTYNSGYGFVMSKFLIGTAAYGTDSTSGAGNYDGYSSIECSATVRVSSLSLYTSPDTSSKVITTIPNGATIYVSSSTAPTKNWLLAVYNNKMGYVLHKNIEVYPSNYTSLVSACQRYGAPLLKKGQTSDYVMVFVQDIRNAGWHTLSSGRTFDDELYKAVREFQSRYGLKVDGIVGNETKLKLFGITNFGD